jgi:hypothetical protein
MLQPLISYVLLATGLALCLYLFVTLKGEIRGLSRACSAQRQQVQGLEGNFAETRLALAALETDLRAVECQTGMLVAPVPARSGLNLSKRTQVLRMHRTGHDSAAIAAELALPRSEVELLIRVHRIVLEHI